MLMQVFTGGHGWIIMIVERVVMTKGCTTMSTMTARALQETLGRSGRLKRALDRIMSGRELSARRYVNGYLLSLDDATLVTYGFDRGALERIGERANPF
jgi:hypothetical protein